VLDGEQVPTSEKIYSIFEPHTDLIKRGKVRTPVEFGHKIFLAESAKGLITQYDVLKGNPVDEVHVAPSLRRHRRTFRRVPQLYGADRGFFSERNVMVCVHGGVATVSIPQVAAAKRSNAGTTNDRRRRRGACQQSHDHRRAVDQTLQTPPQNQPTMPQLTNDTVEQTAALIATLSTTAPRTAWPVPKITREALATSPGR
jgi:hypothetical protein